LAESYSTGRNPFENESKSESGFSIGRIGAIAAVLGIVGFATYQFTKPEVPKPATAAQTQMPVNSDELRKQMFEGQKKEFDRDAKLQQQMQQTTIEAPKFDKELMQKSVEQRLRNQ
jgi:hypothetical protein